MRNVSAKNRSAWLELFAEAAVLQDPVGVSPFDPAGLIVSLKAYWQFDEMKEAAAALMAGP